MARYPDEEFAFRLIENVPGVEYDPDNKRKLFAEDLQEITNEIAAIEEALGLNINGSFDTLKLRIEDIEANLGSSLTVLNTASTIDDSNLNFVFSEKPVLIYINRLAYPEGDGWTWAGSTATLTIPVGDGGSIFGTK